MFIDGQHGTVGLKIRERLAQRDDIDILEIDSSLRKDRKEKQRLLNEADIVFLCLPDDAARESVSLVTEPHVRILDGSTAHRTHADWAYGIPELHPGQRDLIRQSHRITVPGCYATGFNMLLHPLVSRGIVPSSYQVSTYAITGYSGGGKQMIADFSANGHLPEWAARPKNLNLRHKHLPEMHLYSLLDKAPLFSPIVANFYNGMLVFVPLYKELLLKKWGQAELIAFYQEYYQDEGFLRIIDKPALDSINAEFLSATTCNDSNDLEILVFENDNQIMLVSRLDNLGKGASGAAVQNMNILLGVPENTGL